MVEVRVVDPWTFQLEVQESKLPPLSDDDGSKPTAKRVTSVQLKSGGMDYFCLHARTPSEQIEWRSVIKNYVSELAKHQNIKRLQQRTLDHRRSVTFNAVDMELERVMNNTTTQEI